MAILDFRIPLGNFFLPSFALTSFYSDENSLFTEELSFGADPVWPLSDTKEKRGEQKIEPTFSFCRKTKSEV